MSAPGPPPESPRLENARPILLVADLEASLAFYESRLGFRRHYYLPELGMAGVVRDEAQIGLAATKAEIPAGNRACWSGNFQPPDVSIMTPSVDAICAELASRGVVAGDAVKLTPLGLKFLRLDDPDGYCVAFIQPYAD